MSKKYIAVVGIGVATLLTTLMWFRGIDHTPRSEELRVIAKDDGVTQTNLNTDDGRVENTRSSDSDRAASLDAWVFNADDPDPVDFYTVARPNEFLLFPSDPYDVYAERIERAEAGDAESMFWISKAFWGCRLAPRNQQELAELTQDVLYAAKSTTFEHLMNRCQRLSESLPLDVDFWERAQSWLERSANAGYKTAVAQVLMERIPQIVQNSHERHEELLSTLSAAALEEGYPAYYLIELYLDIRGYPQVQNTEPTRSLQSIAWNLAACRLHAGCDEKKVKILLETYLYPHQTQEVEEQVALIERGEFEIEVHDRY